MNWLAHIFLSEAHIEYQHGNLLADLLKGKGWDGVGRQFEAGLEMHRRIDRFTDSHPRVRQSKSRLAKRGYLKGVVIDITYDHLLARNWRRFSNRPIKEFIETFHRRSGKILSRYPDEPRHFLSRLLETGHLFDYSEFTGINRALQRIDQRLSARLRAKETALSYLPLVRREISAIETDFLDFMPDLIQHFKTTSGLSFDDHWLR